MRVVFLDRDGVINQFPGNGKYVTKVKDFHFLPGSLEAIKTLTDQGFIIFIVSNQACVGRGIITLDKLDRITKKMMTGVKKVGGKIRHVYYATARPDEGCKCRKPNIGSIQKAVKLLKKDMRVVKNVFFVGDAKSDIQTGKNAGCKTILVRTGRQDKEYFKGKTSPRPDHIVSDLLAATDIILSS